jgi:multiple sugar transport system ATP-binding protein
MDEPLSSLDAKLRAELRIELKRIQNELGATILYVTHDQTEAMTLGSQVGVIENGRVVQFGTPREVYENPLNAYVAARLGAPPINLAPRSSFPEVAMPEGTATVGVRTEHAHISKANGRRASGRVTWVEHLGDQDNLHVTLGEHDFVTLADPDSGLGPGDDVTIALTDPLFFNASGERVRA